MPETIHGEASPFVQSFSHVHSQEQGLIDDEVQRLVQKTETTVDTIARRATSTPTPRDDEHQQLASIQSLGITKQIDEVLNDMKSLLTHGREVVIQHQKSTVSHKESKIPERMKPRRTRKERATAPSLE